MNQNGIGRSLFVMTLGAIAGGITGYLITELIVDKIYNQQFEDDDENEVVPDKVEIIGEPEVTTPDRAVRGRRINYADASKPNLEELVNPYKIQDRTPRIITQEDWSNVHPLNDKQTVTYYEDDTTFADANDEIIPNPNDILGPNIHLHFGEGSEDPDIVYVRADYTSTDYEIIRVQGTYQEIVMGVVPEVKPPPKKATKRPRKKKVEDEPEDSEE